MAGRPKKSTIVVKEIEEVKESPIEKEAVDISEKEELCKNSDFKKAYEQIPIRRGTVKCDTPTSWLNVRNAPNPNGEIIGKLDHGSAVDIFEIQKDFGKISATENKWVSLAYIV